MLFRWVKLSFQSPFHRGNGCNRVSKLILSSGSDFQSPFHRGNGCNKSMPHRKSLEGIFQSPFHRGNGCNWRSSRFRWRRCSTFSPLFIGVTVVTISTDCGSGISIAFQSPFHRGNGCNTLPAGVTFTASTFQSPFHRGNGCNRSRRSLLGNTRSSFSPLFIGVTVVTNLYYRDDDRDKILSVPFSSG